MRNRLLMLVMMSCMAGAQLAPAQTQSTAPPAPVKGSLSDINHAISLEAVPNATANPTAAASMAVEKQMHKNSKKNKKNDTANMQPDDPRKNPYWEPRDWTYINNQAP